MFLVHILVAGQTAGWRRREIITPHPDQWCKVKRVARTSTPLGRCLCTDTGAGCPGSLFWSKYPQCGRTSKSPGHCSDLIEIWVRWQCFYGFIEMLAQLLTPGGAGDATTSLSETGAVHHHPSLIGLLPCLSHNVGCSSWVVITTLGCTRPTQSSLSLFIVKPKVMTIHQLNGVVCWSQQVSDWLTDWFAGPLSLAVPQADTLQHVATRFMGSPPGVTYLVWGPTLMAAV